MQKKLVLGVISVCAVLTGCQSNPIEAPFFGFQTPMMSNQANLAQSVQAALTRSGDPAISQVHVEAAQNQVILSGYVKKIRQSDTAEQIARQVPGVQNVQNRIIVRP